MPPCRLESRARCCPWWRQPGAAIASLVLAACAPATPLVLEERGFVATRSGGTVAAAQARPAEPPVTCRVELRSVTDRRRDPDTLGTLAGRPVRPPVDAGQWLTNSLSGLRALGVDVVRELEPGETADLAVAAELRTAWVTSVRTNKSANVVVSLRYLDGSEEPAEVLLRGHDASTNWSSSDGEIMRMFDRVFARLVESMAADIHGRCG